MFTGIIQGTGTICGVVDRPGLRRLSVSVGVLASGLKSGASVAIDGVCLTAIDAIDGKISFDIMSETLSVTTLGLLKAGDAVNVERSLKFGDEVGGHILSGHVDFQAEVVSVEVPENNYIITFKVPRNWMKYIFSKGYVGINGASLTIVNATKESFQVYLIPETLKLTNLGTKNAGDRVNIEIDRTTQAIVNTVENYMAQTRMPAI